MGGIIAFIFLFFITIILVGLAKGTGRNRTTHNTGNGFNYGNNASTNNNMMQNGIFFAGDINNPVDNYESGTDDCNCGDNCDSGNDSCCDSGSDCGCDSGGDCGGCGSD